MSSLLTYTRNTRFLRDGLSRYVRSDVPDKLTGQDIQWLLEHDIRTVIDLRAAHETETRPCPLQDHPAFFYHSMPVCTGDIVPACPEDVPKSYHAMLAPPMADIVALAESAATNVLYFCNAGKDRTGVLSALLLRRMGAEDEEIIQNYVLTAENLREFLAQFVAQRPHLRLDVVTPREWYMEMFLADIEALETAYGKDISKWSKGL